MGKDKSSNPMDEFRRRERKKQLQKDKTKRIQERDATVKATKTVAEVKAAIAQLEHRKNKSHHDFTKLQRLQKELKLVTEAAKEKAQSKAAEPRAYYENRLGRGQNAQLDDPRKSVYYDAQMNPYGAPPPGKPRLYHARGGGTTMNPSDAIVPGQPDDQTQGTPQMMNLVEAGRLEKQRREDRPQEAGRNEKERKRVHSHIHHRGRQGYRNQQQKSKTPLPPPPPQPPPPPTDKPPELPPPSAAVKRGKKRHRLEADIWASADEIHYEQHIHGIDLEAGGEDFTDQWHYKDLQGQLQGPFGRTQMQSWASAGFFPPSTPVRNGKRGKFTAMGTVDWTTGLIVQTEEDVARAERIAKLKSNKGGSLSSQATPKRQPKAEKERMNADRIDAEETAANTPHSSQRQTPTDEIEDEGVAARIAALRGNKAASALGDPEAALRADVRDVDSGVMARIAALRGEQPEATSGVGDIGTANYVDEAEGGIDSGVAARIEVLRGEHAAALASDTTEQDHPPPESSQIELVVAPRLDSEISDEKLLHEAHGEDEDESNAIEDRIEALRKEKQTSLKTDPPVSSSNTNDNGDLPGAYPIDDDGEPPSAYPLDDDGEEPVEAVTAYPVGDDDEDQAAAYPVDEDEDQIGYQIIPYPVSESYPVDGSEGDTHPQVQSKKVSKIDKDVVAFLPTNVQGKRRKKRQTPQPVTRVTISMEKEPEAKKTSVSDDYNDFMAEINQL